MKNERKPRKLLFGLGVLGVATLHFLVSFLMAFAAGIGSNPALRFASNALVFPLSLLPESLDAPAPFSWLAWVGVSLAWGFGICSGLRFLLEKRRD